PVAAPAPRVVAAAPPPAVREPAPPPRIAAAPVTDNPTVTASPVAAPPAAIRSAPVTTAAVTPDSDLVLPPRPGSGRPSGSRSAAVATSGTHAVSSHPTSAVKEIVAQGPRDACGSRTQFSLYRCMKAQCEKPQWFMHPSCKRLRLRD